MKLYSYEALEQVEARTLLNQKRILQPDTVLLGIFIDPPLYLCYLKEDKNKDPLHVHMTPSVSKKFRRLDSILG